MTLPESDPDFDPEYDADPDEESAVTLAQLHEELIAGSSETRRGNRRMLDQGTLDFHRGNVVACHQHDVIYAAKQPNVAILVFTRTIPCKV